MEEKVDQEVLFFWSPWGPDLNSKTALLWLIWMLANIRNLKNLEFVRGSAAKFLLVKLRFGDNVFSKFNLDEDNWRKELIKNLFGLSFILYQCRFRGQNYKKNGFLYSYPIWLRNLSTRSILYSKFSKFQ